jgi:hypothetical protein
MRKPSRYHHWFMSVYYAIRDDWLDRREDFSRGYATEMAEFARLFPRPTFKWYLINQRRFR